MIRLMLVVVAVIWPSFVFAQEQVVLVPPGVYQLSQVMTTAGTAESPIRYRPEAPGTVTIRGGGGIAAQNLNKDHVILDGFLFDGMLHPDAPTKTGIFNITASNIRIENSDMKGPKDIHTHYDANDQPNCDESDGFPNGGGAFTVSGQNVTFDNVTVHGFYNIGTLSPTSANVLIINSMMRNNFSALTFQGISATLQNSVVWDIPNHNHSMNSPSGTVRFLNNLIVSSQEVNVVWTLLGNAEFIHNTVYAPPGKTCGNMAGYKSAYIDKSLIRDNIFMMKDVSMYGVSTATQLTADHNLFFHHGTGAANKMFVRGERDTAPGVTGPVQFSFLQWQALGFEASSVNANPQFVDAPVFQDFSANQWGFRVPTSAAEARSWFALQSTSPAKGAASDGLDMGIIAGEVVPPPPGDPVDCVVSEFGEWVATSEWSACVDGSQSRTEERTRTVLVPPSNGGLACPALSEQRTVAQTCTTEPPPPDEMSATPGSLTFTKVPGQPVLPQFVSVGSPVGQTWRFIADAPFTALFSITAPGCSATTASNSTFGPMSGVLCTAPTTVTITPLPALDSLEAGTTVNNSPRVTASSQPTIVVPTTIVVEQQAAVDCVVSEFSEWTTGTVTTIGLRSRTREETRERIILTPPSGGGAECPALIEQRTIVEVCAQLSTDYVQSGGFDVACTVWVP